MNIATLIRFKKGTYEGIWNGNRWAPHGNLVEIARHYGIGMTVIATETDYEKICQCCDGLIIPGSPIDIDPTYYGGEPFDPPNVMDEYALDSKVIAAFDKMGKPMLGICGGHQALNVFYGGTLRRYKEMREPVSESHREVGTVVDRYGHEISYNTHMVNIDKESFLYDVYGSERARVNTYHAWALDRVAEGFKVVARSDDGIVEAIEWKEKNVFGTQYHPELAFRINDPVELKLFENFFRVCEENTRKLRSAAK